jgi:hypothetical protein
VLLGAALVVAVLAIREGITVLLAALLGWGARGVWRHLLESGESWRT